MKSQTVEENPQGKQGIARAGASLGLRLTFAYAAVFALYAILRIFFDIFIQVLGFEMVPTLLANAFCVLWSVFVIALFTGAGAVVLGAATGWTLEKLVKFMKPGDPPWIAALIGLGFAVGIVGFLQLVPYLVWRPFFRDFPAATYWLWFGIPSFLYLLSGAMAGWVFQYRRKGTHALKSSF